MAENRKSLYRTYRPATFESLAGHKNVVDILIKQLTDNKISHALLFAGQRGTGKTSVARIFAKSVNCKNLTNGISCEECESCKAANVNTSPDIFEIDAASNNGVDEIRGIKSNVSTLPILGKYKVYIIDEVHMLTKAAFNALLKTLEEPPSHAMFVLATTEYAKIPATIVSRCQTFNFKKIDKISLKKRLSFVAQTENYTIDEQVLDEIYYLSDGSLRDGLNILEQLMIINESHIEVESLKSVFYIATKNEKLAIIKNILEGNSESIIKYFETADNQGMDFDVFSLSLIEIVKEIIEFKLTNNEEFLKILDIEDANQLVNFKIEAMFTLADNLSDAYAKTKGTTINFNYLLISLLKAVGTDWKIANNPVVETQPKPPVVEQKELLEEESNFESEHIEISVENNEQTKVEEIIEEALKDEPKPTPVVEEFKFKKEELVQEIIEEVTQEDVPLVQKKVSPELSKPIITGSDIVNIQSLEIVRSSNIESHSVQISDAINLLVAAKKEHRDLVQTRIDSWFATDEQNKLLKPEKASKYFVLFNTKVIAVSREEILVKCDTLSHSKLLNLKLENKNFRNELTKEFGKSFIIYPIDSNKWEDVKNEFKKLKAKNTLPEHISKDAEEYYAQIAQEKLEVTTNSHLLDGASKLFNLDDIEIGE